MGRTGSRRFASVVCLLPIAAIVSCGAEREAESGNPYLATLELEASCPEPFSYLSGVRELSDGTILAADPISQVLLRLDLDAGTADTLGRQGAGPQEYEGPDQVFALPGDSTLLVDLGNGRLTVIDPEGTFVAWTPRTTKNDSAPLGFRIIEPRFVDSAGNIYETAPYWLEGPPDSFAIHRIDRASGIETPVARGWMPAGARSRRGKLPMLVPYDSWAVGADGCVALVRANGYSVDWYLPDGSITHGPANDAEAFPVGPAEKEAQLESYKANATFTVARGSGGNIEIVHTSRGMPPGTELDVDDDFEWPDMMPVFSGVLVSPRGEAWVERYMPAGGPGRVEVFDERAVRVGLIELPPQSRVIGFGAGGEPGSKVYLTRIDDVGLIWLERCRVVRAEG